MINNPLPFEGLNIGIPSIVPIKGRGFVNLGSGLEENKGIYIYIYEYIGCRVSREYRNILHRDYVLIVFSSLIPYLHPPKYVEQWLLDHF